MSNLLPCETLPSDYDNYDLMEQIGNKMNRTNEATVPPEVLEQADECKRLLGCLAFEQSHPKCPLNWQRTPAVVSYLASVCAASIPPYEVKSRSASQPR